MLEKLEEIPVGRAENLIGQKFGHLTVLYRVRNYANRPTWQCQCDCGRFFTVTAKALKNGSTKSCGCSKNENHIKNHVGERHGKLVVQRLHSERASDGTVLWECKCDCGNVTLVRASNIDITQSCGKCFRGKDLSNQRFGKLTAIKLDHISSSKKSVWECKCDCGGIVYVNTSDLLNGRTQSCGCLKSRGEDIISKILTDNNIPFEKQKTFKTCVFPKTGAAGIFDFYVNNNYLIEYDGIQHYKALGGWNNKEALKETQFRDNFKNQWCKENHISLIRIPYEHLDKISLKDLQLETSQFLINKER